MNSWLSLFDPTNQDKEAASDDLPSHIEIKDDNGVGHLVWRIEYEILPGK